MIAAAKDGARSPPGTLRRTRKLVLTSGPCSDPSEHKRLRRWGWTPPDRNEVEGGCRMRDGFAGAQRAAGIILPGHLRGAIRQVEFVFSLSPMLPFAKFQREPSRAVDHHRSPI